MRISSLSFFLWRGRDDGSASEGLLQVQSQSLLFGKKRKWTDKAKLRRGADFATEGCNYKKRLSLLIQLMAGAYRIIYKYDLFFKQEKYTQLRRTRANSRDSEERR